MSCDIGEVMEMLENEQAGEWVLLILQSFHHFTYITAHSPTLPSLYLLILQAFRCFTYVTTHSPTLPSLYLRHSSFSNPSVVSPTLQLILKPFFCFSYLTGFSLTSSGEPPMLNTPGFLESALSSWPLSATKFYAVNFWNYVMIFVIFHFAL